jgi:hypothetical protein
VDEIVDQLASRPERSEHEDDDERDRDRPEQAGTAVDPAGGADDNGDEQHAFDEREQPPWTQPDRVWQEDGEHNRRDHGSGHRPARLPNDDVVPGRLGGTGGYRIVGRFGLPGHPRAS